MVTLLICKALEFFFFFLPYINKISNLSTKERKAKFNKLSNDLNTKLIKGNRNFACYVKNYINNGENLIEVLKIY